jgi:hypothetical protein
MEFFERTDEGYRNHRCDAEIGKYQRQVETNRSLGKRGGRPKKTESITESKPNTNPNKIKNKNKNTLSATRFEEFWAAWPSSKRKVGKAAVMVKWERGGLDEVADAIIANVNDLKSSEQWTGGFEPAPMTYINQRRWEDDVMSDIPPSRRVI